jgi:VRR-NUC domain-containing protein
MSPIGGQMTERELRQSIVRAAREFGWRVYFTWSSMHSPAGFPDLCMVRGDRLLFAELKTDKGKVTPDQQAWVDELRASGRCEVHLWRPADIEDAYKVLLLS